MLKKKTHPLFLKRLENQSLVHELHTFEYLDIIMKYSHVNVCLSIWKMLVDFGPE